MKSIAVLALLAFAVIVVLRHIRGGVSASISVDAAPVGVPHYTPIPAPQTVAQLSASLITNPDAVSDPGFAPAFGYGENQPTDGELAY